MSPFTANSDVVRWLGTELEARGLERIELTASLRFRGERYEDTLLFTGPDGALTFGALPEDRRAGVEAALRAHHAGPPARGDLALSIVVTEGAPARILLTDGLQRQEETREEARAQARFSPRPYGRALAQRVAEVLDAGADLSLTVDPREGVSRALWKPDGGTYAYGLRYAQGDTRPRVTFASRAEFVAWLAARSDETFATEEHPDDPRMWGVATFDRAYLTRKTGRR